MRPIHLFVVGIIAPMLASCGEKAAPTPIAREDAKQSSGAGEKEPAKKPAELIRAKWKVVKDPSAAKALSWGKGFPYVKNWQETHHTLDLKTSGRFFLQKDGAGPVATYEWTSDDTIVLEPKRWDRKLTVKISGDEMTLTDEDGGIAKFKRLPVVVGKIKITDLALCCDNCAEALKKEFAKESTVSDLVIDVKSRSVTLTVPDDDERDSFTDPVRRAGMHGFFDINGRRLGEFGPVGQVIGDAPPPPKEIVLKGVHACCPGCRKAIEACAKDAKVTLEGDGPTKTVKITGDKLNENAIILALWKAGFRVSGRAGGIDD
jgi:hypothetical protein